jgi:UDP-N-acetylmuramyl pentapeptide phosphotransferase/UDP-N-acetylglucosamine-1-phosphate transferase
MYIFLLIFILIFSFGGTFIVRRIALKKQILDIPNERSSHTYPTPRGGGIAIVLAWYAGLIVLFINRIIEPSLFLALISGFLLALVGLLDDVITLKPLIRILAQLLTVLTGLYFIGGLRTLYIDDLQIAVPLILNLLVVLGAIWFINLYNFLDGIDGYASTETISIAIGLYIVTRNPLLLILVLSVLGFLIWNWPKAKIFMGDIGSTQLGYILIILSIYFNNNMQFNFIGFIILSSLFWFDATLTLYKRWRNQERLSQAHKKHYYQRIVQYGFSHQKTVIYSIALNLIFIGLVCLSEENQLLYIASIIICVVINSCLVCQIDKRFPFIRSSSTS